MTLNVETVLRKNDYTALQTPYQQKMVNENLFCKKGTDLNCPLLLQYLLSKTFKIRISAIVFFLGSTFRRIVTPELTLVLSSF